MRKSGWFKNTLLFQNQEGTPKLVQIREKTPHKKLQLDLLRIGWVNSIISFKMYISAKFLGGGKMTQVMTTFYRYIAKLRVTN